MISVIKLLDPVSDFRDLHWPGLPATLWKVNLIFMELARTVVHAKRSILFTCMQLNCH